MPVVSPKCKPLLTLGQPEVAYGHPWPDYLALYGFSDEDVPDLLMLLGDPYYDEVDENNPEVWAPLHAWRVLGQLRNPTAVRHLVRMFPRLCDDDAALSELKLVFGLIGPAAIPTLTRRWQHPSQDQFVQVMAQDALTQIALQHPESRDQVVSIFSDYLAAPHPERRVLHGLLIANLLDLTAVECLDAIRDMYRRGIVDISCAGDIEDVEIELGVRDERDTPKPDYSLRSEDFNDADGEMDLLDIDPSNSVDVLEKYLSYYGAENSIMNVSELDGFIAALACAPCMIATSEWVPAIWGGESQMPEWESEQQIKIFMSALMVYYNQVMQSFQDASFKPLFLEDREADGQLVLQVEDWCDGFARGLTLWDKMAPAQMDKLIALIEPVRLFITTAGHQALQTMRDNEVLQQKQKITHNVRLIRQHFFRPAPARPKANVSGSAPPKAGRNDLCPCGSGQKYKKCCLH